MSEKELREKVRRLMYGNLSAGYSELLKKNYCYIMPSPQHYPLQFFWDTCFHIFILCSLKEFGLAKRNLESLFALQEENGFVGHMIFWNQLFPKRWSDVLQARPTLKTFRPHMSALIQPPFVAQALLRIYEDTHDKNFLQEMFPKLKLYHEWLAGNRDFEGEGLISIISPFESGIDWKASFDEVLRFNDGLGNWKLFLKAVSVDARNFLNRYDLPKIYSANYFIVKEVGVNTVYAKDLEAMAKLSDIVQDNSSSTFYTRSKKVAKKIFDTMYDKESCAFFDVYDRDFKKIKVLTPTIFFPMVLDEISDKICGEVYKKHLFNRSEFYTPYPIPSLAANHASFNPGESPYIWRGPTWVIFNWFLYRCLKVRGYRSQAFQLKETVKKLIELSSFREYYNPFTGAGHGAINFTWSGLVIDMN